MADAGFPLLRLPLELVLEVLRLAASPEHSYRLYQWPQVTQIYRTATALALVSSGIRQAVMPHLLQTVILNNQATVTLFLRAMEQQREFEIAGSRLKVDYKKYVRRIWSTEYFQPLAEQPNMPTVDYRPLYDLFSQADSLGFNAHSLHLLYEVLGGSRAIDLPNWACKRLTFAGSSPMWNPLTSTNTGLALLSQLTHLTIWSTAYSVFGDTPSDRYKVPNWMRQVAFSLMPNLTKFAFSLIKAQGTRTTAVLVYTRPPTESSAIFREWALDSDPLKHGTLIHVNVEQPFGGHVSAVGWEFAYLRGENDIWPAPPLDGPGHQ
ncbi:hypothetical protein CVT26_015663 [Gymnopilus dilepis]|uniref:Uncharacterized protein n=1 Tax=Gymnopilus dilepis TaxID=231916 RepID=A0A409VFC4_9AGAR|nr:hypothetical protein CVT26_015663 [Gymnopilus dilepis]